VLGHLTSDDGASVRVALAAIGEATFAFTAERGRVVARLPLAGMLAVWSIAVDGVVQALTASHDGVLVELEDGDAFRLDARTGAVIGLPGLGLAWYASGELVTGAAIGGPIPGQAPSTIAHRRITPVARRGRPNISQADIDAPPPPFSTPIKPPPALGDSWQLTLYELTGGLRARSDYALQPPIAHVRARGPAGSPLAVVSGPGLRDVLVLDPRTGDPVRRVQLPDGAPPGVVFSTVVEGTPVVGALLASPLRLVVF
jgi:hypothetical protein